MAVDEERGASCTGQWAGRRRSEGASRTGQWEEGQNSKIQTPKKSQIPRSNSRLLRNYLEFGPWRLEFPHEVRRHPAAATLASYAFAASCTVLINSGSDTGLSR